MDIATVVGKTTKPIGQASWQQRLALTSVSILLLALAIWMLVTTYITGSRYSLSQDQQYLAQASFEAKTGIRVVRVALVAAGGIVDLQYQIVDPDKSLIVHDDKNPPTLINEKTGRTIDLPFHDHSFKELKTAVIYHELLINSGRAMQRGDRVTIIIGGVQLQNMIVQ